MKKEKIQCHLHKQTCLINTRAGFLSLQVSLLFFFHFRILSKKRFLFFHKFIFFHCDLLDFFYILCSFYLERVCAPGSLPSFFFLFFFTLALVPNGFCTLCAYIHALPALDRWSTDKNVPLLPENRISVK